MCGLAPGILSSVFQSFFLPSDNLVLCSDSMVFKVACSTRGGKLKLAVLENVWNLIEISDTPVKSSQTFLAEVRKCGRPNGTNYLSERETTTNENGKWVVSTQSLLSAVDQFLYNSDSCTERLLYFNRESLCILRPKPTSFL
jgi:hypothetical protein